MRLLLDTHIALWLVAAPERLPPAARDLIIGPENQAGVSTVSIWETALKHRRRKARTVDAAVPATRLLELLIDSGIALLPMTAAHAAAVDTLPPHHSDPFDRLLVAQARAEPMRLVTVDAELPAYGESVLLV